MGRAPCCDKAKVKRGPWSPEEDYTLKNYVETNGTGGNWIALPHKAGLKRCGKSCRLRWLNYLRPNIKHGGFTEEEDNIILSLYHTIGSRWSVIASQLPGRTDNDVKNYWNTKLKKKLLAAASGPYPSTATGAATSATTGGYSYTPSTSYINPNNNPSFTPSVDSMLLPYVPLEANFNQETITADRVAMEVPNDVANTYSSSPLLPTEGILTPSPSFSIDNHFSDGSGSLTSSSTNGSLAEDEALIMAGLMAYDVVTTNAFDDQETYTEMYTGFAYSSPYADFSSSIMNLDFMQQFHHA